MSDVEVIGEEVAYTPRTAAIKKKKGSLTQKLIAYGIAKTEKQANVILLIVAGASIALTAWFLATLGERELAPEEERAAAWMAEGKRGAPPAYYRAPIKP